jgi:predicted AlkP superfamily phosphohydrolase/phosphomutase
MSRQIIVIGLDGATMDLIRPWASDGQLPNLARMMAEGVSGELRSTVPPVTAPAWVSFMTGKNPGKHGIYHFRTYDLSRYTSYDETLVTSRDFANQTMFRAIGGRGLKVASLAVPMTYPPFPINGLMLSGYPTPNLQKAYTYPPEVADSFSNINITSEFFRHSDSERIRSATHMVKQLTSYCVQMMQEDHYDLFVVVYGNTDMANHFFRKYVEPDFPCYDAEGAKTYGSVLMDQYRLADEAVGRLLEQAAEDAVVIIMSDHGSDVIATKYVHTNAWLNSEGFLRPRGGVSKRFSRAATSFVEYVRIRTPWARDFVKRRFPTAIKTGISASMQSSAAIDWSRTKAYRVPMFFFVEGIEINVKGRQPQGIVEPGREYEELRGQIMQEIGRLRDPRTGKEIVTKVVRKEEEYSGPMINRAPDIIVFYDPDYSGGPNPSGPVVTDVERYKLQTWSGQHRMNGTLIMWGSGVRRGLELESADITDLAPTIMYLLGLPVPSHMDGKVLAQALEPSLLESQPITVEEAVNGEVGEKPYMDDEEEKQIREALRGFGYID